MSDKHSIPSLDGIRALAILAVVFGHSESPLFSHRWLDPFRNGSLGVIGFFVLSGFLITGILVKEIDRTGSISLKRFYARRSFRIFPAFYTYLIVIAILGALHYVKLDLTSWLAAATYTWNYVLKGSSYSLGQTWSLSLEEQFYLLWPLCLVFFSKRTCFRIAIGSILLSPFSRVLTYVLLPAFRGHINMMLHTHVDAILTGAALALAQNLGLYAKLRERLASAWFLLPIGVFFAVHPILSNLYRGSFGLPIGMTLDEVAWAVFVIHVIRYPKLPVGQFLNWAPVAHIGRISYSVYLWQQLFTGENQHSSFPINLIWIFLCAEGSYWLIEQPFLRLRERVVRSPERRGIAGSQAPVEAAALE